MRSLYDGSADRKYLSYDERLAFFEAVKNLDDPRHRGFCWVLLHTGCRISEALALTTKQLDPGGRALIFLTLKQKGDVIHRPVPAPRALLEFLGDLPPREDGRLFSFGRTHGYKIVKKCMRAAGIDGVRATPTGLRHGYAIGCVSTHFRQAQIQALLGHKRLETTSIYTTFTTEDIRDQLKDIWFMED